MFKKKLKSLLSIILAAALLLPSVLVFPSPKMGVTAEETEQSDTENTNDTESSNTEDAEDVNGTEQSGNDNIVYVSDTARTYICDGFTVDYSYSALWNGDKSINLTVTNTDSDTIENWALLYDFGGDVTNIWGGSVQTTLGGVQFLGNAGYNADLAPNQSAYIGYALTGATADFPENFHFIQHRTERVEGYTASLSISSAWGNNINGTINITNTSDTPVRNWELEFASNFNISDSWVAGISIMETPVGYRLKGVTNTTIAAGASVSLSFAGTVEDSSVVPEISDVVLTEVTAFDYEPIDYELDSDGDGLPDYLEDEISTDKYNADTDGDELPDGYEYYVLSTDPLLADTDNNGISDAVEDFDEDGLSNLQEFQLGTNPFYADTDEDGFTDSYEVSHGTSPLVYDEIVLNQTLISQISDNSIVDLQNLNVGADYPLEIEYNDEETQIISISGQFSNIDVNTPIDALYAVYSVKNLLGLDEPENQLELAKVNFDEAGIAYLFQQTYDGICVSGRTLTVSVDNDGTTCSLSSTVLPDEVLADNVNLTPAISQDDIADIVEDNFAGASIDSIELIIYSEEYESLPLLAYKVVISGEYIDETLIIDADSGDIIHEYSNISELGYTSVIGSGKNEQNETVSFPVSKAPSFPVSNTQNTYTMEDINRKIYVYDKSNNNTKYYSNDKNVWNNASNENDYKSKTAISAYTNTIRIYDWWGTQFKYFGVSGIKGDVNLSLYINDNDFVKNAFWRATENSIHFCPNGILFEDGTVTTTSTLPTKAGDLFIVGHEYTHGVICYKTKNSMTENKKVLTINEAYADIFGVLADNNTWIADNRTRNIINPNNTNNPYKVGDEKTYTNNNGDIVPCYDSSFADPHQNATIISHAAYLMNSRGISFNKMAKLWYGSLSEGFNKYSDFNTVRANVIKSARKLKFTNLEITNIKKAFDDVNVVASKGNIKVTVVNDNVPIVDAAVSLYNYGQQEAEGSTNYLGYVTLNDIETGTNTIKVEISGYAPVYTQALIEKGKTKNITVNLLNSESNFAWTEYDHYNYSQSYVATIPKHITYVGSDIKMIGYSVNPLKDFLLVQDDSTVLNHFDQKILSFKIKRDANNWHTMEGGGFLFNASVTDNILRGFCVLVTEQGLKLYKINGVNVNTFRNGTAGNMSNIGTLLGTYNIGNVMNEHSLNLQVTSQKVSLWDGDKLIIDDFELPANSYGFGFGPITSHISHSCGQISYFTFSDIVMLMVTA